MMLLIHEGYLLSPLMGGQLVAHILLTTLFRHLVDQTGHGSHDLFE